MVVLTACADRGLEGAVGEVVAGEGLEIAVGEGWEDAESGELLPEGTRVRAQGQTARLRLRSGEVWLGSDAAAVVRPDLVDLLRGEVVVASAGPLELRWAETGVRGEGVYRVTTGAAPRLGVYRGLVEVERVTETRRVRAFRELALSPRRLPRSGEPLTYRADDEWDQALLPHAIAFDEELTRFARGLDRIHGSEPREVAFYDSYTALTPAVARSLEDAARVTRGDAFGPPSDTLLTLLVARAAAAGQRHLTLAEAVERVTSLRAVGARWGLVAVELEITPQRFSSTVDAAQSRHVAISEDANGDDATVEAGGDPTGEPVGAD